MDCCKFEGNKKEVNQGQLQEVAFELGLERGIEFELALEGGDSRKESLEGPGSHRG